jgi:hypothetical protein
MDGNAMTAPDRRALDGIELEQVSKALETYVEWHGALHDDDCPGDDTCSCSTQWVNNGVNEACRLIRNGLASLTASVSTAQVQALREKYRAKADSPVPTDRAIAYDEIIADLARLIAEPQTGAAPIL